MNLKAHLATLRATAAASPTSQETSNIAFYGTHLDKEYLPVLKSCVAGATCFLKIGKVTTIFEVKQYCASKNVTKVISTSPDLLIKLLELRGFNSRSKPKISQYAGSLFHLPTLDGLGDIEIVFVHPLKQAITVPSGRFMLKRLTAKVTNSTAVKWMDKIPFSWSLCTPESFEADFAKLDEAAHENDEFS